MKQYPRSSFGALTSVLAACAALSACGGGGGGDSPTAVVQSGPATNTATAAATPAPAAVEAPAASQASPSPSALANADAVKPATQPAIETLPPFAEPAAPAPKAVAAEPASAQTLLPGATKLPVTLDVLLGFNTDLQLNHEALPAGVPAGYDWYLKGRMGAWNTPPTGFTALTGWGQAFWAKGTATPSAHLLMKNHMTLVCHGSQRKWSLLQSSGVQGAVFQPDFANNVSTKAHVPGIVETDALAVSFPATTAYHFWPSAARGVLPSGEICGTLTLVQARAEPIGSGSYDTPNLLLGMGADYWLNATAPWDNYKTNRDVAIGRLKLVKTTWAWYGVSTASDADLKRLFNGGFVLTY